MFDSFSITILFIVISSFFAAFMRRKQIDKCLLDFKNDTVSLEKLSKGISCTGKLDVEFTGLEFVYMESAQKGTAGIESSYILYKYEYPQIQAIIRFHDALSEEGKQKRLKELEKTYHPNRLRRSMRQTRNMFKTVGDSFSEVLSAIVSYAQKSKRAGAVLSSQGKYVDKMKKELVQSVGVAFEPLLEKYIGHRVVFEMIKNNKLYKFSGVLKEYTVSFIEIMDVDYFVNEGEKTRVADIIIPQKLAIVRHSGELKKSVKA